MIYKGTWYIWYYECAWYMVLRMHALHGCTRSIWYGLLTETKVVERGGRNRAETIGGQTLSQKQKTLYQAEGIP